MAACSLLTNLDDLNGGNDATSDVETGEAGDAGGSDAPVSDAEAGVGPFCSRVDATFCDDFEEDGSFSPPWTALNTQGDGSLTRAVQDSGCVLVALGEGDAAPAAYLTKAFTASASKIHYAFDLQVRSYATSSGATANVNQFYLPLVDGGGIISGYVYLALSAASSRLVEQHHSVDAGFSAQISAFFTSPLPGTWTHFDVMVDLVARSSSVAINGVDAGGIALSAIYQPGLATATAGVEFETVGSDQFSVFIDNTVVWLE
jgi:hypothetical protein